MRKSVQTMLSVSVVFALAIVMPNPAAAVDAESRTADIIRSSEAEAAGGIDVVATSTANRPSLISRLVTQIPGGVAVRDHLVVASDGSFYHSIRRNQGRKLLGSLGFNPSQGNWATPSTMYRDGRSTALIRSGQLTPTTAITGLNQEWPYSYFTPQSATEDGTNFPWYLARQIVLPYNLAYGHMPIRNFRQRITSDGGSIITGQVDAGTEPETDRCRATNLTIRVDGSDRIRESRWTRDCPRAGGGRILTKITAKASYGLQSPKRATSPSIEQSAILAAN